MPAEWRGGVVAIGNFDGVHRGHQAVLRAARAEAERLGVPCLMLTFEPHPRAFFSGRPLFRLTPAPLKAALAAALGLDGTLVLTFDRALAGDERGGFRARRAGRAARRSAPPSPATTSTSARRAAARRNSWPRRGGGSGFSVTIVDALTRRRGGGLRDAHPRGACAKATSTAANRLLGWSFAVSGEVVHGDGRGRELGYPTANMALDPASELAHGIYAVRFLGADGVLRDGVASYGRRPMFGGGEPVLETFVFDFSGDLYGETALVSFHGFIRAEERFDSVAALVARMDQDSIDARAMLERTPPGDLDRRLVAAWTGSSRRRRAARPSRLAQR